MGELINGRTPEDIKKWLNCLAFDCGYDMCGKCEYDELCKYPGTALLYAPDALSLIERLESERDAALNQPCQSKSGCTQEQRKTRIPTVGNGKDRQGAVMAD